MHRNNFSHTSHSANPYTPFWALLQWVLCCAKCAHTVPHTFRTVPHRDHDMITFKELLVFFGIAKQHRSKAYSNYLESLRWFIVRNARVWWDGWNCVNCGARYPLQVHHLNYQYMGLKYSFWNAPAVYLWSMLMEFLYCRTLCRDCHWYETKRTKG